MSIKTGVVVLAHGSKVKSGNEGLFKIVEMLRAMRKWDMVEACFLQLAKPGLTEAVEDIVGRGAERVVVMPLLLFSGNHVMKDIPEEIEKEQKKYPEVEFCYAKNIGADERIAQITRERIEDAVNPV
ncbi:MAG: CbiX/SirB N-terminal domain-containing protein [Candidatus Neomarinimicrobiota bacterium]|jgi:precorrin-8X/cobalt-precorrin-8 methylmutase|nr:CbiX/SirB N-terminal domain-containing protein [Candidatus Neomarinimicrobiota bacterium]HJO48341.1 CbiX/SirB N-terminal domain-containing protein [Candidatus Scalindua sp.]